MKQATEVYSPGFDEAFRSLSPSIRTQIAARIRELGRHLEDHPHHRLQGRPEYRLRVADFRVFYTFDPGRNLLYPPEVGHRREVYR